MVRAPCCEKMGLKKGPWTQEEDHILISYIHRYGHSNWRALPKQAGLLRCGKSCRLRWMNYLRPDIKRGNYSREEEDMIINLHEMFGNRWSAIAARLPGRTDNEIKNVWHTHLKKRVKSNHSVEESKRKSGPKAKADQIALHPNSVDYGSNPTVLQTNSTAVHSSSENSSFTRVSPGRSHSTDLSSMTENYSNFTIESTDFSSQDLDESFWNEALSMENCATAVQGHTFSQIGEEQQLSLDGSSNDEDMDFWLRIFMEAGELHDLPQL